jgi:subtilase family serine protease
VSLTAVSVDGGSNDPGVDTDADGELMLDVEVAGSVAPGAHIVVYFTDGTSDRGFLDAITTAVHDQTHTPSVISISWGAPASEWTAQNLTAFDQALADAAQLGVTVLAAAGDHGAGDNTRDRQDHGTELLGRLRSTSTSEVSAWRLLALGRCRWHCPGRRAGSQVAARAGCPIVSCRPPARRAVSCPG